MNIVIAPILRKFTLVFLYYILIDNKTMSKNLENLKQIIDILQQNHLFAKPVKCTFPTYQVEYLGHVTSPSGVSTNFKKIEAISKWPQPENVTQSRSFF
jgi:hypothetical protein